MPSKWWGLRVVVTTCDKQAHVVPLFVKYFQRAWPDCPFDVEFVGNTKMPQEARRLGKVVLVGEDEGWSTSMLRYIGDSTEPFLLLLEDFFLADVVRKPFQAAVEAILQPNVGQVRVYPDPGPTLPWNNSEYVGKIDKQKPYALSLQAAFWKPQVFRDLLVQGENPWQVETRGARRARSYGKYLFLGTYEKAVVYKEYLRRGEPIEETVKWMEAVG